MEKLIIFESGLRLVLKKNEGVYSNTVGVWVGTGSSDETIDNNGISHFIEHMLFKGTERRSAFEISDSADRIGAQMNAFTSKECTCYYIKAITEHTEFCFDLLSDMLFNSKFDEEELNRERDVVLEEISMTEDVPDDLCVDVLCKSFYGDSPLGKTIIGTAKNVRSFSRQDVKNFMKKQYNPKNIVISIAGNFDEKQVEQFANKYFASNFKNIDETMCDKAVRYEPKKNNFMHKFKGIEQAHIALAFPTVDFTSPNIEKMLLVNNVLGGGMSSRLFQSVREKKGLAYSVFAYPSTYQNNGMITIYAGVNPAKVEVATKTIRDEIDNYIKNGMSKDEFLRGKEQLKGSFIMGQESTSTVMNALGKYMVLGGRLFNAEQKMNKLNALTYEETNDYVKEFLDYSKVCGAYVGKEKPLAECNVVDFFLK